MVLIGAISNSLPIPEVIWRQVIVKRAPKGTADINLRAFQAGRENLELSHVDSI
jgi:Pyruvate/2-oxoacid:ferredoxin oxidoreductase gamma subunit